MNDLGKPSPNARASSQPATVYLITDSSSAAFPFPASVTRIMPKGIRLALAETMLLDPGLLLHLNRCVEVDLEFPGNRPSVRTRGEIVGIAMNFLPGLAPLLIDLEFLELSTEESKTLRDTNPHLVA